MAIISSEELFEQAEHLLIYRRPLNPSQTDIRRAVSAAYYGVSHLICIDAADLFAGKMQRKRPAYGFVYRSLDHKNLKDGCQAVQFGKTAIRAIQPTENFTTQLVQFAASTIELQDARHRADYDPLVSYTVEKAQVAISSAREAMQSYRQITEVERRTFLTFVMFKKRP